MAISFKQNFDLKQQFSGKMKAASQEMEKALQEARTEMLLDTSKGKGFDGSDFGSYSKAYADKKGRGTRPVTLRATGNMLEAIQTKLSALTPEYIEGKIFMGNVPGPDGKSSLEKARIHMFEGAGKKKVIRRFFGLSDRALKTIVKRIQEAFNRD